MANDSVGEVSKFKLGNYIYKYTDAQSLVLLEDKVDKIDGKGLSEEDFTFEYKTKLDGIEDEAQKNLPIDFTLDAESDNPISNSAVSNEFSRLGDYIDSKTQYASSTDAGIVKVGNGLDIEDGYLYSTVTQYDLPIASNMILGGIRVGGTLEIDDDGVLNVGNIGTNVSITPETVPQPSVKIASFEIDGVPGELYAPQGGGGGGGGTTEKDILYENQGTSPEHIILSEAYTGYDLLYFIVAQTSAEPPDNTIEYSLETSQLNLNYYILIDSGSSSTANWFKYTVDSTTGFTLQNASSLNNVYIKYVIGVYVGGDNVTITPNTDMQNGVTLAQYTINGSSGTIKYDLPVADANNIGGVKVGNTLSIDNGVLDVATPAVNTLANLSDTTISSPVDGQCLKYDGSKWINANVSGGLADVQVDNVSVVSGGVANINTMTGADGSVAGSKGLVPAPASTDNLKFLRGDGTWAPASGSGVSDLDDLSDVTITSATNGQVLKYNNGIWVNADESGGGGTVTDVQIDNTSIVSSGVANITTMTGAGASTAGTKGLVPAPASGDNTKFLRGDGSWQTVGGSNVSTLDDLTDVTIVSPTPGQVLTYVNNEWVNTTPSAMVGNNIFTGTTNPDNNMGSNGDIYIKHSVYVPQIASYFRFKIRKNRNTSQNYVHLSEFVLQDNNDNNIIWSNYGANATTNVTSPTAEGVVNVIDGNVDTTFTANAKPTEEDPVIINIITTTPVDLSIFQKYGWYTASNLPARDPVSWTFSVSVDGVTWTDITPVDDNNPTETRKILGYSSTFITPSAPLTIVAKYIKIQNMWVEVSTS